MMIGKGMVKDHAMFKKAYGDDFGWVTNECRIKSMNITLSSAMRMARLGFVQIKE